MARGTARALHAAVVTFLAAAFTLIFFMVLPLLEQTTRRGKDDLELRQVGGVDLPPPPPPPPEEKQEEEKPDEPPPPELADEAPPLDLAQLELALNPGFGDGVGDFAVRLPTAIGAQGQSEAEAIFSAADLDQQPRAVYQPAPEYPAELRRKKVEGTVHVLFIVDKNGKVLNPMVQKSSNPALEPPALQAVRRWRFDPGKRQGRAVQFKMRIPISFTSR
jgi:protein TonB